jgi:hypothetical protein
MHQIAGMRHKSLGQLEICGVILTYVGGALQVMSLSR